MGFTIKYINQNYDIVLNPWRYTNVNYTDVNYINNSTDNSTCVDNVKIYDVNYNYIFINITPDIAVQTSYIIIIFFMIATIRIKYKSVFFAAVLFPFGGVYTFTMYRYIQIFYYLNKMKEVTYCKDITQQIYSYEIMSNVMLSLITIINIGFVVLLTRENNIHRMRVNTNSV